MSKIDYWKGERRRARTALRNYIVANVEKLEKEYAIIVPENIKNFSGEELAKWIKKIEYKILQNKKSSDLYDLLIDYHCACTNVATAENGIYSL